MTSEFDKLSDPQRAAVTKAIARCQQSEEQVYEYLPSGGEAYAYPHTDGVAWGINGGPSGYCIARGVWTGEGN